MPSGFPRCPRQNSLCVGFSCLRRRRGGQITDVERHDAATQREGGRVDDVLSARQALFDTLCCCGIPSVRNAYCANTRQASRTRSPVRLPSRTALTMSPSFWMSVRSNSKHAGGSSPCSRMCLTTTLKVWNFSSYDGSRESSSMRDGYPKLGVCFLAHNVRFAECSLTATVCPHRRVAGRCPSAELPARIRSTQARFPGTRHPEAPAPPR